MEYENFEDVKLLACLVGRLELLLEGFDESNKNALVSSRFKILLQLSFAEKLTPSQIKQSVGLAKSNVAILCNKLLEDGLIQKIRDSFDNRAIFYSITEMGKTELNEILKQMNKNIKGELAYKNNFEKINKVATELFELVK